MLAKISRTYSYRGVKEIYLDYLEVTPKIPMTNILPICPKNSPILIMMKNPRNAINMDICTFIKKTHQTKPA